MPVIVFASSKGGAGKTTACVVLACELARQGQAKNIGVSLIDADPNQHSAAWAKQEATPSNIRLFEGVNESNILDVIEQAQQQTPFVLVDLEGVASSAVIGAVSRADLVIIPCQPSQNDAKEAAKTIKTINAIYLFRCCLRALALRLSPRQAKPLPPSLTGQGWIYSNAR